MMSTSQILHKLFLANDQNDGTINNKKEKVNRIARETFFFNEEEKLSLSTKTHYTFP